MSNKEQHSFSSIVSVNPYKNTYVNAVSSFLSETQSPEYTKNQFTTSYINTKDFLNSQISISKNIPDEDIYDAIFNKVYDEVGLDQAITYYIQYIEIFNTLDEENRTFHVFIVDPLVIEDTFVESIENIKYLDNITPSPLLIKSLYAKDIIEDGSVACFIYFQENDTFITIYDEKEFIYTKSLNYSFKQMHERFCEIFGEQVEYSDFINFLSSETLKDTTSSYKEPTIKLYKEIFANINDILTYVKRALNIEVIEDIYIDSQVKIATHLDEMAEVELNIKSNTFDFEYGFESEDTEIDHMHMLMHLNTTLPKEDIYHCNFTTYHRPPKFVQRESGRVIMLAVASLILAFVYPVSYWTLTYAQNLQYTLLQEEYREVHNIKITREATIKNREADKSKTLKQLNYEKDQYVQKKNTLIKIHDVKVNYPMKASLLYTLTKDINRYSVKLESIVYKEDEADGKNKHVKLGLVSSRDKKITDLLKYLTRVYEGKFNFSLEEISYEEESKLYFSEVKVNLI
ncbi:hypothetical protein N9A28_06025 [Sulfurimonas sp.]|nr:hypothetical protein [Sulfurimonas sp.]